MHHIFQTPANTILSHVLLYMDILFQSFLQTSEYDNGGTFSEGVVNVVPVVVKNYSFCSLSAKRNCSLPHPDDINDMASGTDEVRTFGDEGLIFYEAGECGVAHSVEPCAHIVSRAVG